MNQIASPATQPITDLEPPGTRLLERVRELLDYNPETGIFTWNVARGRVRAGQDAGSLVLGYWQIKLDGKKYYAHRLAWLYVYGSLPESDLDHVNGRKNDNRIANLRLCNDSLNHQNLSLTGQGTTGYLGVTFNKEKQKFQAQIGSQGALKYLGRFDTALEAHGAYLAAKKTIHQFQGWRP